MPLPLIPIALSLAQYVPGIVKWISSSDKAADAASAVVDIARTVTGHDDPNEALDAIRADPAMQMQFQLAVMSNETELDRMYLEGIQGARNRDVDLAKLGKHNTRADVMVLSAAAGLLACLLSLVLYREKIPPEAVGIISTIAGLFGSCLKDAFSFEFGSSRSSQAKDLTISNLSK